MTTGARRAANQHPLDQHRVPAGAGLRLRRRCARAPVWAIGFCGDIVDAGDHWIVTTPGGEQVPMRSAASTELRVLDSSWELGPRLEGRAHTRVVANGEGATYVFTMVQPEGMADEFFEAQSASASAS